jgi:thiol:disulfide interchange protein
MSKRLITIAILVALPFLLLVGGRGVGRLTVRAGDWMFLLAAGIGLALLYLVLVWTASRGRFEQSNSRLARWLQSIADDDD